MDEKKFSFALLDSRLIFKTTSFRAEKGSVLHSGIYSRELSSTFIAFGISLSYVVTVAFLHHLAVIHYIISGLLFVISFPVIRTYLFRESYLETLVDKGSGRVTITNKRPIGAKTIERSLDELRDIRERHISFKPENPDGIAFVEKIALQHGTVIPGFGQTEHFHTVELIFPDIKMSIFSSPSEEEALDVMRKFKTHIDG